MKLVIFDLPAVIDYRQEDLRPLLQLAVEESLGREISLDSISWEENCSGVLLDIYKKELGRFPSNKEYLAVKAGFLQRLKDHFMKLENLYDVQHGVQSILMQLQSSPDWGFCIVSDYWQEATHFMLDSCGIYRKNIELYTADDALSSHDLIQKITSGRTAADVYFIGQQFRVLPNMRQPIHFIAMKGLGRNALNRFSYPKFTDLFKRTDRVPKIN
ncbi:MAG: hypothetical protein ACPF9D_06500 [Owenweeksia sp.]